MGITIDRKNLLIWWKDSKGLKHPIGCDWVACPEQASVYVGLDEPVGPYDKGTLCRGHLEIWQKKESNRQANLNLQALLG